MFLADIAAEPDFQRHNIQRGTKRPLWKGRFGMWPRVRFDAAQCIKCRRASYCIAQIPTIYDNVAPTFYPISRVISY